MFIKKHIKFIILCLTLLVFSIITCNIYSELVSLDKRPIFVLPTTVAKDGGTTYIYGIRIQSNRVETVRNKEG